MTLPREMPGWVLTAHGGPECLSWREDLPVPVPARGDVVLRVDAAAVNNTDINTRVGWYSKSSSADDAAWGGTPISLPRIQGIDCCGTIVAVGEGISAERIGERVLVEPCLRVWEGSPLPSAWFFGSECDGAFAAFTRVPARHAHRIDSPLSAAELATFPCSYSTAENMLTRAAVTTGERVLITGASGGVGSAAVQLAKARGATVIAVSQPSKADGLRGLGADEVIDRAALGDVAANSVDVALDLVGGAAFPALISALRPMGRYAVAGAVGGAEVTLDLRDLYLKDLRFFGCTVLEPEVFPNLVAHIEAGRIAPVVAATYPLKEMKAAQEAFATNILTGKIALTLEEI